jgi:hypothetical protein
MINSTGHSRHGPPGLYRYGPEIVYRHKHRFPRCRIGLPRPVHEIANCLDQLDVSSKHLSSFVRTSQGPIIMSWPTMQVAQAIAI